MRKLHFPLCKSVYYRDYVVFSKVIIPKYAAEVILHVVRIKCSQLSIVSSMGTNILYKRENREKASSISDAYTFSSCKSFSQLSYQLNTNENEHCVSMPTRAQLCSAFYAQRYADGRERTSFKELKQVSSDRIYL